MFFLNRLFMKRWKPDRWDKHSSQVDHPVFVNMWRDLCTLHAVLSRRIRCGQGCKVVWQCFRRLKITRISHCLLLPKHTVLSVIPTLISGHTFNFKSIITKWLYQFVTCVIILRTLVCWKHIFQNHYINLLETKWE